MSRKPKLLPLFKAVMELAEREQADKQPALWTRDLDGGWAVAVNFSKMEKRAQHGAMNMGVGLKHRAVAVWSKGWLVAVVMEQGGTFLPRDSDTNMDALLGALSAAKRARA